MESERCMFCGTDLPNGPENLAFMEHIESHQGCDERFGVWMENMQTDFLGD